MHFFTNCPTVIYSCTVCYVFEREASSENYGPRVYLYHIIKTKIPLLQFIYFYFILQLTYLPLQNLILASDGSRGLTTLLLVLGASICFCVCMCCSLGFGWCSYWFDKPWFSLREILISNVQLHPSSSGEIPT